MSRGCFRLLAGLGNPGTKYLQTRHNIGYMALEKLAKRESASFKLNKKLLGHLAEIDSSSKKKVLLLPNTFMNESGRSINAAIKWFDLEIHQILILVDDMDLPLGKLRLREEGGSGGHNGLKSIIQHLGSEDFCRLKIGIGAPSLIMQERKAKTTRHVLGRFDKQEEVIVEKVLNKVVEGLDTIKKYGLERGTTFINSSQSSLES
ncbi:aminoacyl-tRNA hydrolase [Prochlorococcus marinus]|uniref:aminoacyl-tRNA hydrolase n=1 Tax=Prochlorococcus marinus TaxID=1219 RepID=UPI0022B3420F|nr:aminoacyl-tRNA hydrolase [Prochlorococcus marinus]